MPTLEQSAQNSVRKQGPGDTGSVTLKTTFSTPTVKGRLVIAVAFATGGVPISLQITDTQFSPLLPSTGLRDVQMAAWYVLNAPVISSVTITMDSYRGVVLRLFEISGIAQSAALDKNVSNSGENASPSSGQTGTLAQSGEYVFSVIGSQYDTTTQAGFTGGLSKIYEDVVPNDSNADWERGRVTFHHGTATGTAAQRLGASLSTTRRWIGFLATFKSGVTGPVKFTSTDQNAISVEGRASLSVFGRLKLTLPENGNAFSGVEASRARIGPFEYQYRIGGWGGLLIGKDTPYPVESVDGLEGWTVRDSDQDHPREDGAIRGLDLQQLRLAVFKLRALGDGDATRDDVEGYLEALYNALTPQRYDDLELIFRHPGRPLRSLYYRPSDLIRRLTLEQALAGNQTFTLRAADPKLYSTVIRRVIVPVSPDETEVVTTVGATNAGNARAYPHIFIDGPTSGPDVTRVSLFNASANVAFDVATTLQSSDELIGDMRSRVTGGRTSVVTVNGASKYGAWQQPRSPFYIAPDPEAVLGVNVLYLRTEPVGAPVTCTIEYRDTWSG